MKSDFSQGVDFSHYLLQTHLDRGVRVIDATIGNGNDTLYLARLVGKDGLVWGFDVQKKAIKNTRNKLEKNNCEDRVQIIHDGHENMDKYIENKVSAVIFNLGYLPAGNKEVITRPETTLEALKISLTLLKPEGIIVLVIYTGHDGGKKELKCLLNYAKNLDHQNYNVLHYHFINQKKPPAEVLAIKYRKIN